MSTTATVNASLFLISAITMKSGTRQPVIAVALVFVNTLLLLTLPPADANVTPKLLALVVNSVTWLPATARFKICPPLPLKISFGIVLRALSSANLFCAAKHSTLTLICANVLKTFYLTPAAMMKFSTQAQAHV